MPAHLEHANFTVSDATRTARWMTELFGWRIRWEGPAKDGGKSIHIGTNAQYLALYQPADLVEETSESSTTKGYLNHVGVVVDDLDAIETRAKTLGFAPENHADYEPGRRFYFQDGDGIEYEVVQYDRSASA